MKKAYRNMLIISTLLSAISLILLGGDLLSTDLPRSVLAYTLYTIFFTVVFSSLLGLSYYVIEKKGSAYRGILTFSVLLMLTLFTLDYTVLDTTPEPSAAQIAFELLVYGSIYVGAFFMVFSGIYFTIQRTYRFAVKRIK